MTYYPMSASHVTGQDDESTRHAVELYEAIEAGQAKRDAVAVCGQAVVALCGYRVVPVPGQSAVAEWPPFSFRRCTACFAATGRPRVGKDSVWRNQEQTP